MCLSPILPSKVYAAAVINPDPVTNPVQTMEDYFAFLDWSAGCMPRNILDTANSSLYANIDQSLDYFYFLPDQPLPELAGKGYYDPCLEYHEPIASWVKQYMETGYGLVAILPVAMSQVSSCNWEESVQVGAEARASDPMGYFLFGGSDIVMI